MSILKLSKNDIIKTDDANSKIKLKKNQLSYDSSMVSTWESSNKDSLATLNKYTEKLKNNEYMSSDDLKAYRKALDSYIDSTTRLRTLNKSLGTAYDEEDEKKWNDFVSSANTEYDSLSKYYSQFDSEDAFKTALAYNKEQEKLKTYDVKAAEDELKTLTEILNTAKNKTPETDRQGNIKQTNLSPDYLKKDLEKKKAELDTVLGQYGVKSVEELEALVNEKSTFLNRAKFVQKSEELTQTAINAPDFEEYSQKGAHTNNPSWEDASAPLDILGWKPLGNGKEIGNMVTFAEENKSKAIKDSAQAMRGGGDAGEHTDIVTLINEYMTDDEKAIYNYYVAKEGTAKANEYLDSIKGTLQARQGQGIYEDIEDNLALEYVFGAVAGLDQFASGIKSLMSDEDYIHDSAVQVASGMVREDLKDDGFKLPDFLGGGSVAQAGYDMITTTANMAPSILLSSMVNTVAPGAGAVVGAVTLGASASGNAYAEMLNLGYNKNQARAYSALVGASEAGLQYALGGIGALGGGSSKVIAKLLSKVDNAFFASAIKLGGSMLSEGIEESLQTILEPWFKSVVANVDYDAPDVGEVLYSGLLGALSAGILEGGGTVAGEFSTSKAGKQVINAGAVDRLAKVGSTFAADSVAYQLAGKINENTGAYTVGRLLNEVNATLTDQNMSEIVKSLERKGVDPSSAQTIAKWLYSAVEGETFTEEQIAALEENEVISKTFIDVIYNENSTVNQRRVGYNDVLRKLADEVVSSKSAETTADPIKAYGAPFTNEEMARQYEQAMAGEASTFNAQQRKLDQASKYSPESKASPESEFSASEDGKTTLKTSGEEVSIKEISSIKDGEISLRLDNGNVINAKEVNFATADEALIYEAVTDMNAASANAMIAGFDPNEGIEVNEYILGFKEAYKYGSYGFPASEMSTEGFSARLTEAQKHRAYNLGKIDAKAKVQKAQEAKDSGKSDKSSLRKGKVIMDTDADQTSLTKRQKTSIKALEVVAETLGVNIHIFESATNEKGEHIGKNGWYDPSDNSIHIDLYAGAKGESTILFTAAHELTHFIREWSPAKFKIFADFLMEQYGEKGVSIDALVNRQIAKAKQNGRNISYDVAYEEVVADSAEAFLVDGDAIKKLASKDMALWEKIKSYLTELVVKIKKAYAKLNPDSVEGNYVRQMRDTAEKLHALWTDALLDAGESYSRSMTSTNNSSALNSDRNASYEDYDKPITKEDIDVLRTICQKSINDFTSTDIEQTQKWAYKFYKELGVKSPYFRAWFGDWRAYDKTKAPFLDKIKTANVSSAVTGSKWISDGIKNGSLYRGNVINNDTRYEINIGRQVYNDTLTYANRAFSRDKDINNYVARLSLLSSIKEIAEKSVLLDTVTLKNDETNVDRTFVHKFYATAKVNNSYYVVKLTVDEFNSQSGTIRRAYNVNNIEISPIAVSQVYKPASTIGDFGDYLSESIIADLFTLVNSSDADFKPNSVNPLLLNDDGTPKVFYHGTNIEFTTFDLEKSGKNFGRVSEGMFFFTDKKDSYPGSAKDYARYVTQKNGGEEKVFECFLSIKKPLILDSSHSYDPVSYYDSNSASIYDRYFNGDYDGIIIRDSMKKNSDSVLALVDNSAQIKSATDNIGTFNSSEKDIRYSDRDSETQNKINSSMTMAEAKRMVETAFKVHGIAEYYDGEYKTADEWLKAEGVAEVELYIENDYALQQKYINSNEDILNEEYAIRDVLDAYLAGTLVGKEKPKPKRLDVSKSTKLKDSRFYAPQKIEEAKKTFELAKQKAVGKEANSIIKARAEIILFAHNKGAAELLGITQAELNKKLRSWSNYSATAKNISERINAGVAEENRWTGIENSCYVNKARVTDEDIERLVASVEGDSRGYQRKYIARVMLAADTHIDYSGLKFKFGTSQEVNRNYIHSEKVLGFYDDTNRVIEVTHDKPHTVAHEMGHYIDAQWGRDLLGSTSSHLFLTRGINEDVVRDRHGEPSVQFLKNFKIFMDSLTDVNSNYSSYTNDRAEVFARFFARFIEWTDNIATGNKYYSYESSMYNDKFTQAQFVEFARLLQEKALLDGNITNTEDNVKYSERDTDHSQAALEEFGTTSDYEMAGFALQDGRMLKLSKYGLKGVQHRQIESVFDDTKGNKAVNRFIQEGNVRINASAPGIEIGTKKAVSVSQLNVISRFISKSLRSEGYFYLDITDTNGKEVASVTYDEDSSVEDVMYDIKEYYSRGRIPREHILYSDRENFNEVRDNLINKYHINVNEIIDLANSYIENYGGMLTKTNLRLKFLEITEAVAEGFSKNNSEPLFRASEEIKSLAAELVGNPKDMGSMADELRKIKKYLRKIRIKIPIEKGDFDTVGGFDNFRKKHINSLVLAKDGIAVDSLYPELQEIFGRGWFPDDVVTVPDQLLAIAAIVDTPLSSLSEISYDIDDASEYTVGEISERIISTVSRDLNKKTATPIQRNNMYINDRDPDSVSNRSLLADALESAAQNDIERNKLKQYKEKIALLESEQAKLSELKQQANELRFKKGRTADETKKMRDLEFEANQTANRINTYDRQLLNLESTKALKGVLEREKKLAYKKAEKKGKEALSKYREKAAKTQRDLLERHQQSRKEAIDKRHRTEMRHKIKSVVSELNQLLLHGSKERNIKLALQPAVASALEAVNFDTVAAEERVAKYNALIAKATDPDVIESLTRSRDNIQSQGDAMASRLENLRRAYADIKANKEDAPDHYRAEAAIIEERIDSVISKVGNTPLRNMTLSQLEAVYELYRMVLTTVRNVNSVFKQGKLEDLQNNVSSIMTELSTMKTLKEERTKAGETVRGFSWNEMIPVYAFERIGSKTFTSFFWETVKRQNTFAEDISEADDFATATRKKYGYNKWDVDKIHEFKLTDGRNFRVSLKHMMSIYAYSKRDQAHEHMLKGGFFFNDKETFRKKGGVLSLIKSNEEGYSIDDIVLGKIKNALTKEQILYVDEMQDYLTKMGEKGNEVSRVLWGIDIFKEKVYFPLKSSRDFIFQANQTAQEASLKNDGMTKEIKPGASNPIVLEAFDDVWASHVNRMSQYHSFVLPIENLNKIHNYGTWAGTASMSVSTMLSARHGNAVNEYLTQFIQDLNGASSVHGASNPFFGFVSKFKKTAVAASASVVVQQPTAVLRSLAVMDMKYFIGLPEAKKLSTKWDEMKKYAPITIIKDIGGFDAGAGRQATEWLNSDIRRGVDKVTGTIDDLSMMGATLGDQLGWSTIWEAVKREIKATTNLKEGSEAFFTKVGERFTEVIVKTQVYDSTLSRSGYMRSKHDSVKMLTAFMGEPTVSFNMLYTAVTQAKNKKMSKRQAGRMIGAVYASTIAASVAASLIYALRDDDDDESYAEKLAEALGGKLKDDINPLNMLPAVRDIVSIFDGWDVERTDVAIFKNIKDAFDGLNSDKKSTWRKIEDFAGAIASAFGLPLKNVMRSTREIYNAFKNAFDGIEPYGIGDAFVRGISGDDKSKSETLYDAVMSGQKARIERAKKQYKDQSSIDMALRQQLREKDHRIKKAAEARLSGDNEEYIRIVREIKAEGNFSQDLIVKAINTELESIRKAKKNNK